MRGAWWMPLMLTAGVAGCSELHGARSTTTEDADRVAVEVGLDAERPAEASDRLGQQDVLHAVEIPAAAGAHNRAVVTGG